ncbi:Molybdopterin synthase sulfur carrier subunit [hydrothermal vent metagenome]|uniref:Molybdopterin synthase sulfur carrier subunit n=1 Tax=hydrothermal vent metagenome TaxID=652676 RepID=A0A3B0YRD1_9ZZZZ
MDIKVRLFAGLRERYGMDICALSVPENVTVREVWSVLLPEEPLPENVLAACNMEYVSCETTVSEGDEIAFFPPVTGGSR